MCFRRAWTRSGCFPGLILVYKSVEHRMCKSCLVLKCLNLESGMKHSLHGNWYEASYRLIPITPITASYQLGVQAETHICCLRTSQSNDGNTRFQTSYMCKYTPRLATSHKQTHAHKQIKQRIHTLHTSHYLYNIKLETRVVVRDGHFTGLPAGRGDAARLKAGPNG